MIHFDARSDGIIRIGQNLGSVEAAALPVVLRGLTVDVTSMNKIGCASLAAISAVALADMSQTAPQVFILASSELALKPIRARIAPCKPALAHFQGMSAWARQRRRYKAAA
jgi:hypothetical protein